MSLHEKRKMVNPTDKQLSISKQCRLLSIHKSGLYYNPKEVNLRDHELMRLIDTLHLEDPTRGTRRISDELKDLGYQVGRSKARRLMRIMRVKTIYCKPRTTISDPTKYKYPYLLRELKIKRPNQVWAIDITYIPMKKGFLYLAAIIDIYSRYIVGWSISNSMEAEWITELVKTTIEENGAPEILNSDQGSQFTSEVYVELLKTSNVKISMDGKGRATDNAFIERFFRTIKYDKLYLNPAKDGVELYQHCKDFIHFYNERRKHSSIGKLPPAKRYKNAA